MEKPFFRERDFCSREDIDYAYLLSLHGFQTGNAITLEEILVKYKQYLIEQGEVITVRGHEYITEQLKRDIEPC